MSILPEQKGRICIRKEKTKVLKAIGCEFSKVFQPTIYQKDENGMLTQLFGTEITFALANEEDDVFIWISEILSPRDDDTFFVETR